MRRLPLQLTHYAMRAGGVFIYLALSWPEREGLHDSSGSTALHIYMIPRINHEALVMPTAFFFSMIALDSEYNPSFLSGSFIVFVTPASQESKPSFFFYGKYR